MARASDRRRFLESTAAWAALVALRPGCAFAANLPRKLHEIAYAGLLTTNAPDAAA